jgi:hypothetical protein
MRKKYSIVLPHLEPYPPRAANIIAKSAFLIESTVCL